MLFYTYYRNMDPGHSSKLQSHDAEVRDKRIEKRGLGKRVAGHSLLSF